jgi:hypothetical protein
MKFFHIQLHPNVPKQSVEYAEKCLQYTKAIGRGLGPIPRRLQGKPLSSFLNDDCQKIMKNDPWQTASVKNERDLTRGDVGLVRGGRQPVALVEITGPDYFAEKDEPWGWYQYRHPVRIIGWYDRDVTRWPKIRFKASGPSTFQLLTGKSNTRRGVELWLAHYKSVKIPRNRKEDGEANNSVTEIGNGKRREGYKYRPTNELIRAEQREDKLVRDFQALLEGHGRSTTRLKYKGNLCCDIYESTRKNLIEAKGTTTRQDIRMAIGQLFDYRLLTQKADGNELKLAILLPKRPERDVELLLDSIGIGLIWKEKIPSLTIVARPL